ncbi:MAG: ATP-binding cassette domain-containing protein [Alphaproteobacteria bacterium]|nr:ATP-binding cassette domain-containing protein [Alphaproteobacteria bacterium]
MTNTILDINGVSVSRQGKLSLDHLSLSLSSGTITLILGANGVGKSTLLATIMGFYDIQSGTIKFDHTILDDSKKIKLPIEERAHLGIGYCPERRRIFPDLNVFETLSIAYHKNEKTVSKKIEEIYKIFPQLHNQEQKKAWQLSSGQQQMLSVGRALMMSPKILLLDEPTLGLSPAVSLNLIRQIRLVAKGGTAVLITSSTTNYVLSIAHHIAIMKNGYIVEEGSAEQMRENPIITAPFFGQS